MAENTGKASISAMLILIIILISSLIIYLSTKDDNVDTSNKYAIDYYNVTLNGTTSNNNYTFEYECTNTTDYKMAVSIAKQSVHSDHLLSYIYHAIKNNIEPNQILENVKLYDSEYVKSKHNKNNDGNHHKAHDKALEDPYDKPVSICPKGTKKVGCIDINAITHILNADQTISQIYVKDIKQGDYVSTSNGFSQVYFTYEHNEFYKTINLVTTSSQVKVTENHIVPIIRDNKDVNIKASDIIVGDIITIYRNNIIHYESILTINYSFDKTKYVLTKNDDIIVNDIVVSCHVDNHCFGTFMTYPLRLIHYYCADCVNQHTNFIQYSKHLYENTVGYFQ